MSKLGRFLCPCWLQRFNKKPWKVLLSVVAWASAVAFLFIGFGSHSDPVLPAANVNGRLLLQKVVETKATPTPTTPIMFAGRSLVDLEPAIGKASSDKELADEMVAKYPHLPVNFWLTTKGKTSQYGLNKTCAVLPAMYDLVFNNMYWQTLKTGNGTFYLYSAFYDNRPLVKLKPVVRVVGMIDRVKPTVKTYCQMWFGGDSKKPLVVPVIEYKHMWVCKWGNCRQGLLQPYLIACKIPNNSPYVKKVPEAVSLVEKPCETATNNLRVIYNKVPEEEKKDFAVCVKGLDFLHDDLSVRLVEWIEMLNILGADKIFMYELAVHPNISKVLRYYEQRGLVELTPLTLPGGQPNIPGFMHMYLKTKVSHKRQNEIIPYNDCLYKNMYRYKYLALLDTDEVIMPLAERSWKDMMEKHVIPDSLAAKNESRASYNFRNVYFLDDLLHEHGWFRDIPKYMHMLQHVERTYNYTKAGQFVKCFHNTERVLTLHNHFPLACLEKGCTSYSVPTELAHLQHYRADCVKQLKKTCGTLKNHTVTDTAIWRFKDELIQRTTRTLLDLDFFKPYSLGSGMGNEITMRKQSDVE